MEPKIVLSYDISFEDYLEYNKIIADLQVGNNRKRTTGQGIIIAVLAAFLLFYNIFFSDAAVIYTVIGVVMLVLGLYCATFYPVWVPKMFKKSVEKAYEADRDGFKNRVVSFYDDHFTDLPDGGFGDIPWESVASVMDTEKQILILFPDQRGVILPKDKIDYSKTADFLKEIMTSFEKEYLSLIEKGEE